MPEESEYFDCGCLVQVWEEVLVRTGTLGQPSTGVDFSQAVVVPKCCVGELAAALGRQVEVEVESREAGDGRERGEGVEGPCLVAGDVDG